MERVFCIYRKKIVSTDSFVAFCDQCESYCPFNGVWAKTALSIFFDEFVQAVNYIMCIREYGS